MKDLAINCSDDSQIHCTIYEPNGAAKGAIMVAPATGIKRRFYNSFATFLADNGYGVLIYDNQGIGDSNQNGIKKSKASLVSWGRIDMSAVFHQLKLSFPDTKYHLVGHSAGGQLFGLMEGALELDSVFNVACSSGSLTNMKYPFKISATFFLSIFIPLNNLIFGYTNSQWMGMGEPLPKQVAKNWSEWCNSTGYIRKYLSKNPQPHYYNDIACSSMWINASDDNIANNANVDDMTRIFPKMEINRKEIQPEDYGFKDIGHMKFFSKNRKELWKMALDWFDNR